MWDRFDFVGVSLFTGYKDRADSIAMQLSRVGIDKWVPFWSSVNPYTEKLRELIPTGFSTPYHFTVALKHHYMIDVAYKLGVEHALFFEDDICFLEDKDRLSVIIEALPADYDIALLDWVIAPGRLAHPSSSAAVIAEKLEAGELWARFTNTDLRSCGAYALSRKGMETTLQSIESPLRIAGDRLQTCDRWYPRSTLCSAYFAVQPPCIQGIGSIDAPNSFVRNLYAISHAPKPGVYYGAKL